jgi:ABC-type nitrate/sulfonate/bicarbonate transport system substrate-binding protein
MTVACLLLLISCGDGDSLSSASRPESDAERTELPVLRWGKFNNYQPVYVGVEKGFFEDAGVRVEIVGTFTSGPAIVQAAGTGQLDVGHSAISGIANAVHSGIDVIGVADSQTEFEDAPLMQWFVKADSPIRAATDLRGKTIGTNSLSGSFYYTALEYLGRAGMTTDDVQFVQIPHNNQEQALASGQIDVAGVIDPYSVSMAASDQFRVLFRAVDVIGERQFSLVFFRSEIVREQPDVVRKFLAGYRAAIEYIEENPEQSSAEMSTAIGFERSLVLPHRYTPDAEVRLDDVQYWLDLMREGGELEDGGRLRPADVATDEFIASNG